MSKKCGWDHCSTNTQGHRTPVASPSGNYPISSTRTPQLHDRRELEGCMPVIKDFTAHHLERSTYQESMGRLEVNVGGALNKRCPSLPWRIPCTHSVERDGLNWEPRVTQRKQVLSGQGWDNSVLGDIEWTVVPCMFMAWPYDHLATPCTSQKLSQ